MDFISFFSCSGSPININKIRRRQTKHFTTSFGILSAWNFPSSSGWSLKIKFKRDINLIIHFTCGRRNRITFHFPHVGWKTKQSPLFQLLLFFVLYPYPYRYPRPLLIHPVHPFNQISQRTRRRCKIPSQTSFCGGSKPLSQQGINRNH